MKANVCLNDLSERGGIAAGGSARRRRWWHWLAGTTGLLTVAVLAASVWFVVVPAAPPALALPVAAAAPAGPVNGTWTVATGSRAGFRVRVSALGIGNDIVGQTSGVAGRVDLAGTWVTAARLTVSLAGLRVRGQADPQLAQSLRTGRYPTATFTLTEVAQLSRAFSTGKAITTQAFGWLSLNGSDCAVTVTLTARRDGRALEVAGSIPVEFAYWGISTPAGAGILGSLADNGTADFRLILHRAA